MGYLMAGVATLLGAATGGAIATRVLLSRVNQLQKELQHEQEKRAADRQGRIKAEQALKHLRLQLALTPQQPAALASNPQQPAVEQDGASQQPSGNKVDSEAAAPLPSFPFTAIGTLRSCFSNRTGTPRQPHLVPAARAVLQLGPGIPPSCLEGLQAYSHCWVLYVFHQNTDLAKLLAARASSSCSHGTGASSVHTAGLKSHVRVPRLNGAKMGVLATRTPHRPVPVGLSTAEVISVDAAAGVLVLGGADIVDGSPVLDIKPYVPFCDSLPHATAPDWVRVAADKEPLVLGSVIISPEAAADLTGAWQRVQRKSLYNTAEEFLTLVSQVLARDIRSLHQRTNVLPVQAAAGTRQQQQDSKQQAAAHDEVSTGDSRGRYVVGLDGVLVSYDICPDTGHIHVRNATV